MIRWASVAARSLNATRHSPRPKVLHLTHSEGGGVAQHVRELLRLVAERLDGLVLRPLERQSAELSIEPAGRSALRFRLPADLASLVELLKRVGVARLHLHHIAGLHPCLASLTAQMAVPWDVTLHDYHLMGGNRTMTGAEHQCGGLGVRAAADSGQLACTEVEGWPTAALLRGASRVIAPTQSAARIYRLAFPALSPIVAAHPDAETASLHRVPVACPLATDEPLRVAVLGALSRAKGADLLEACALTSCERGDGVEFHLIGSAYRRLAAVIEHGEYQPEELVPRLEGVRPHLVWFPAQCPETYCYALSSALAQGLPIAVTGLGALPERLQGRSLSWVLDWRTSPSDWAAFFCDLRAGWQSGAIDSLRSAVAGSAPGLRHDGFYRTRYAQEIAPIACLFGGDFKPEELMAFAPHGARDVGREQFLALFARLRYLPLAAGLIGHLPRPFRRRLWHALSARPVTEFVPQRGKASSENR